MTNLKNCITLTLNKIECIDALSGGMTDMAKGSYSYVLLKRLYYDMLRIRLAEEKLIELYKAGHIKAPVHLSIGQEAVAVGVMAVLETQDKIVSTHRCHGHYLAKGGDLGKMFAEILGKDTGCCRGRGGTMHLLDSKAGHVVSTPLVGASISFAVGIAMASKMKKENKIAVAFFGDGAVEEGIFWESLNFASVHRLPIIFVCENNLYATHSPILKRQPYDEIVSRVKSHNVRTFYVNNGNDVFMVLNAAEEAVIEARQFRPCFIEACTYRLKEHWGVGEDWDLGYRSREEGEYWIRNCPLERHRKVMNNMGISNSEIKTLENNIEEEISQAVAFALASPAPTKNEILGE